MTLSEKLSGNRFAGFDGFDLGDILFSFSEFLRISPPMRPVKSALKLLAKTVLKRDCLAYSGKKNGILLAFVASEANARADIWAIRKGISGLGVPMDTLDAKKRLSFAIWAFPRSLYMLFVWWIQLRRCRVPVAERLETMDRMLSLWRLKRFCERNVDFPSYQCLTVFYDSEPHHHLLVRMAQRFGVHTATLQHGIILAPRTGVLDNIDFSGIELLGSCSDTFLAWNDFTIREGVKAGIPDKRFRVVGSSKHLDENRNGAWRCPNSGFFGVLLDGEYTKANNPGLIQISAKYAEASGMKFEVRYHPRFRGDEYDEIIPANLSKPARRGEQIETYFSRMDFVVATNSTAVMDAISFGIPVYLNATGAVTDKYRDLDCRKFDSPESLAEIRVLDADRRVQKSLERNLSTSEFPANAYRRFFENACHERRRELTNGLFQ